MYMDENCFALNPVMLMDIRCERERERFVCNVCLTLIQIDNVTIASIL